MALVAPSTLTPQMQALIALQRDQKTTHAAFEETLKAIKEINASLREQIASLTAEIEVLKGRLDVLKIPHNAEKAAWEDKERAYEERLTDLSTQLMRSDSKLNLLRQGLLKIQAVRDARDLRAFGHAGAQRIVITWDHCVVVQQFIKGEI